MFSFERHANLIQCNRRDDVLTILFTYCLGSNENLASQALKRWDGNRLTIVNMPGRGQYKFLPDCDFNMKVAFKTFVKVAVAKRLSSKSEAQ